MHRGLSNPTRPSLSGPHRAPSISTEVRSASVTRISPMSARLTPTAFQEECSRRDTLSVTMRPLVSLPYYPDFLEYLTWMNSPTSGLNMVTRMGSNVEVADFVTVAMRFANQHLAHVPTIAAGQTTLAEPRHQPAVARSTSTNYRRIRLSRTPSSLLTSKRPAITSVSSAVPCWGPS